MDINKLSDFKEYHIDCLKDPEEADAYLKIAIEEYQKDKDTEAFLLALRDVAEAQGGFGSLSRKTELNRQNLYRALSGKGNPRLDTLTTVLNALGFHLSIKRNSKA